MEGYRGPEPIGAGGVDAAANKPACQELSVAEADLFFSEREDDITRAKAYCARCPIKEDCRAGAVERGEKQGVWGGELFRNGKPIDKVPRRGRPPKTA